MPNFCSMDATDCGVNAAPLPSPRAVKADDQPIADKLIAPDALHGGNVFEPRLRRRAWRKGREREYQGEQGSCLGECHKVTWYIYRLVYLSADDCGFFRGRFRNKSHGINSVGVLKAGCT